MLTFHFLFLHVFLKDQMREISSQLPIWGAILFSGGGGGGAGGGGGGGRGAGAGGW
jgi:hypothetical protein